MALTDYDIRRLSASIVEQLVNDERFIKSVTLNAPRKKQLVSIPVAAELLGVSKSWIYHNIDHFRKTKGEKANSKIRLDTATMYEDFNNIITK